MDQAARIDLDILCQTVLLGARGQQDLEILAVPPKALSVKWIVSTPHG
jgi:hypothetical protein